MTWSRLRILQATPLDNLVQSSLVDTRSKVKPDQDALRHRCPRRECQPSHRLQPLRGRRGVRGRGGAQPGSELEAKKVNLETAREFLVRSVHDRQGGSQETASIRTRNKSSQEKMKRKKKEKKTIAISRTRPEGDEAKLASESG